ncbi:FeoA family protein [Colwellia sp. E2M01]|uniref:FeoA family protein n=1 Tax=Colwellia sp. E2M01 TaxID=2841561 RepID=UPI001C09284B|nr:FeoA family protein [Colwellia sp. E2M01]MBU2871777.1 ferrous iron transport protein A [Colwellia sp. E2M01]
MTLAELPLNKHAKITALPKDEVLAAQLIEQGFTLRSHISLAHKAPFNGPMAFRLHNTKISIQRNIAKQISVNF